MKLPKKKKTSLRPTVPEDDDTRPVRFEALAELTSSEVIEEVKSGLSCIDPLDNEDEFMDEAA